MGKAGAKNREEEMANKDMTRYTELPSLSYQTTKSLFQLTLSLIQSFPVNV